jgi:hypothetical protein
MGEELAVICPTAQGEKFFEGRLGRIQFVVCTAGLPLVSLLDGRAFNKNAELVSAQP